MKYIDLDSLPSYTKLELAERQLDRAIRLLLGEDDAVCAITLAGAAEEILGKLIEVYGDTHSLKEFIDECLALGRTLGENWKPKEFADIANHFRNELKHYGVGSDVTISAECAYEIIDRAAANLWRLTGRESEQVRRYMSQVHGM